jgi:hypothetical protein
MRECSTENEKKIGVYKSSDGIINQYEFLSVKERIKKNQRPCENDLFGDRTGLNSNESSCKRNFPARVAVRARSHYSVFLTVSDIFSIPVTFGWTPVRLL